MLELDVAVGVTVTVLVIRIIVVRGPLVGVETTPDEKNAPVSEAVEVIVAVVTRGADEKKTSECEADDKKAPVSEAVEVVTGSGTERKEAEAVALEATAEGQLKSAT
jgi:hypothetical protein